MARYIQDIYLGQPADFVEFMMKDYLCKNSFSEKTRDGLPVNRRGDGFLESFRYMVWDYSDGTFHLEAWFRGPLDSELSLNGILRWSVKAIAYRREIDKLIKLLQQQLPEPSVSGDTASDGSTPMQPTRVRTFDNRGSAILSLVFGLASTILPIIWDHMPDTVFDRNGFYWLPALTSNGLIFWPYSMFILYFLILIFGRLAVMFYRSGKGSTRAYLAKGGLAFAIWGMVSPLLLLLGSLLVLLFMYLLGHYASANHFFTLLGNIFSPFLQKCS